MPAAKEWKYEVSAPNEVSGSAHWSPGPAGPAGPADGMWSPADGKWGPANGKLGPADGKLGPADGMLGPANGMLGPANGMLGPANSALLRMLSWISLSQESQRGGRLMNSAESKRKVKIFTATDGSL